MFGLIRQTSVIVFLSPNFQASSIHKCILGYSRDKSMVMLAQNLNVKIMDEIYVQIIKQLSGNLANKSFP